MSKKILIFIGIGILIAGLGIGSYFFLIPRCPESCDDENPCTQDTCSKETNYKCSHTKLMGPQPGCLAEVTCGEETCKAGVCQIDYISDCCGNKTCELEETYETCPADCPNCDDNNKLTRDSFNYKTQKCENVVTHYFIDDFEGDIKSWIFHGEGSWSTEVEDGNTFLKLTGVVQPDLQKEWDNYIFKFRFKRIEGSMSVNFRKSSTKEGQNRYLISISNKDTVAGLTKQIGENWQTLKDVDFGFDENWHTLEIRGYDNILNVYMDDELLVKYKDTENPFLFGRPGFEIHTGGAPIIPEFLIDDVEIKVITEKDIRT